MPLRLANFIDAKGIAVSVNPLQVRYLYAQGTEQTLIHFENTVPLLVSGHLAEVQGTLNLAMAP